MKKFILAAAAAAALAGAAGTASAQDLGSVLTNILGYGSPDGSVRSIDGTNPNATITGSYHDEYGRLWVVDQYGKHTMIASGQMPQTDAYGRPLSSGVIVGNRGYRGHRGDRDGDGVPNARDRWPDDPRYR